MADYSNVVIGENVVIGTNTKIRPGVIIEDNVVIGNDCVIDYNVIIKSNTVLGDNNVLYPYSIIGDDPQDINFDKKKITKVNIGNNNIIRENVTIHREVINTTTIGDNNFFMGSVHVAHDCEIKNHNIIANNTLLGGYVQLGNHTFVSGNCGIHQFVKIGSYVMIAGLTRVVCDVPPYSLITGHDGNYGGINYIGLKRNSIGLADRIMIKNYYHDFYTIGLPIEKRLRLLKEKYQSKYIDTIHEFISSLSKKGIISSKKYTKVKKQLNTI